MGSPGAETCCLRAGWKHVANADAADTERVPRDGATDRAAALPAGAAGLAGTTASSLLEPGALRISAQPATGRAAFNPEALSCFSSSSFPGKITDAFNSLARKSNFRAISKKLGLVCPCEAASLPLCPRTHCCQNSSGQSVPVPGSAGSAPPETRTARGQLLLPLQDPWTGVTAGFLVCPDSGPHQCGGWSGAVAVWGSGPGLASSAVNAAAPLQEWCWLHAAAWHWGDSSARSWGGGEVLGWWRGGVSIPGTPVHSLPKPRVCWSWPRGGGAGGRAEAYSGCLSLLRTLPPTCTSEGVSEALSRLILYPEYRTSLQIPRVDGEYDLKMPRDMAYVFSGAYVPLSCKIIEQVSPWAAGERCAHPPKPGLLPGGPAGVPPPGAGAGSVCLLVGASLRALPAELCPAPRPGLAGPDPDPRPVPQVLERRGWLGLEEVVRLLNGNEFSVSGSASAGLGAGGPGAGGSDSTLPLLDSTVEDNPAWESQRIVLAVFLGGCTFSEIAALRFLGKERGRSHSAGDAACRGAGSGQELGGFPWSRCKAKQWPCLASTVAKGHMEGGGESRGPSRSALPGSSPALGWAPGRGHRLCPTARPGLAGPLP